MDFGPFIKPAVYLSMFIAGAAAFRYLIVPGFISLLPAVAALLTTLIIYGFIWLLFKVFFRR